MRISSSKHWTMPPLQSMLNAMTLSDTAGFSSLLPRRHACWDSGGRKYRDTLSKKISEDQQLHTGRQELHLSALTEKETLILVII